MEGLIAQVECTKEIRDSIGGSVGKIATEGHHLTRVITRSGVLLDLAEPDPASISRADIAAGLSGACRFAAQTEVFYSVAQHAVMVSSLVEVFMSEAAGNRGPSGAVLMAALHHDSHEAFMGDLPAPLKQLLPDYDPIAARLDRAIHEAIGLLPDAVDQEARSLIHRADMVARCVEAEEVVPGGVDLVRGSSGPISQEDLEHARSLWIEPCDPSAARELFLSREEALHEDLVSQLRSFSSIEGRDGISAHLGFVQLPLLWFD